MNLTQISDRLGDWNPQLLRELKEKFTINGLTFILIASAIVQVLIGLWLVNGGSIEHRYAALFYSFNWILPIGAAIYASCLVMVLARSLWNVPLTTAKVC